MSGCNCKRLKQLEATQPVSGLISSCSTWFATVNDDNLCIDERILELTLATVSSQCRDRYTFSAPVFKQSQRARVDRRERLR
ncbi:hypothetical protein WG66_017132 [Moniliophthora roreri]|nr:hypothetical protein WG66_017132 [Moniliophthora roreri]